MKKLLALGFAFVFFMSANSQSDKYVKAMEKLLPGVDTLWDADGLKNLSNSFERIAETEKNQWLPYYYAALTRVNAGYSLMISGTPVTTAILDPEADKAESLLNKAEALSPDNSEIFIVKKLIATLRLVADPMARAMTYGPIAAEALAKAKTLDPGNPRVALQEGMDKINTPEQWGGSVTEGKKMLEDAVKKFETFKPQSSIHPNWGLSSAKYFLNR
jgi:hypothetical protein